VARWGLPEAANHGHKKDFAEDECGSSPGGSRCRRDGERCGGLGAGLLGVTGDAELRAIAEEPAEKREIGRVEMRGFTDAGEHQHDSG